MNEHNNNNNNNNNNQLAVLTTSDCGNEGGKKESSEYHHGINISMPWHGAVHAIPLTLAFTFVVAFRISQFALRIPHSVCPTIARWRWQDQSEVDESTQ